MDLNPSQFRLLLAGPKVSRLLPFVTGRGYAADACPTGAQAIDLMREEARHVLLVELELDDMLLADLLHLVRREKLAGAVILIDDPARSGMIISELVRGVDGYVATPPDELYLFRVIERQLLAQWALAQLGSGQPDDEPRQRLEKSLQAERAKVRQLVKDIAALREEIASCASGGQHSAERTAAEESAAGSALPSQTPKNETRTAKPAERGDLEQQDDGDWFDDAVALRAPQDGADVKPPGAQSAIDESPTSTRAADASRGGKGEQPRADERTPPQGVRMTAPATAGLQANVGGALKPKKPADDDEDLFLDVDLDGPPGGATQAPEGPRAVPRPVRIPR